jgi:hypothetical protein
MPDSDSDRRKHRRKADRAEMLFGSGRTSVSNLSLSGAYVSILAGLNQGDNFSFELELDDDTRRPVRGRAVVVWTDPGVGAGVRFELSLEEHARLATYLQELDLLEPGEAERAVDAASAAPGEAATTDEPVGDGSAVVLRYEPPGGRG